MNTGQASESAQPLQLLPVPGVTLATQAAGIRYPDRRDLVGLFFEPGTAAAAVFTRNAFCAAPVILAREHLKRCGFMPRMLLINTGNANAGTGEAGLHAAKLCCEAAAKAAQLQETEVVPFSTGVIGEDLPVDRLRGGLQGLLAARTEDGWAEAACGILTTDTRAKGGSRRFSVDGVDYTLTGIAKGAGMLRPSMATMLAFLATDAPLAPSLLDTLLRAAVETSFHRITVDGDTSTNDAVLLAATGSAGGEQCSDSDAPLARAFADVLESLCLELAQALVRDGEGASKFVEVRVCGAATEQECLDVAFTIAHSPLVKTALFAEDPNWGRVLAAIGRSGLESLDVNGVRLWIGDQLIAERGARAASYSEAAVAGVMRDRDLTLRVDLARGDVAASVWTSDFSYDYVRINAEYRS